MGLAEQQPEGLVERLAVPSDVPAVTALERACFGASGWGFTVLPWIVREDATLHLLTAPGAPPVAYLCERLDHDEIQVIAVATSPRERRRGHATRLLSSLLAGAPRRGARCVTLDVRRGNRGAVALYRRLGFETLGARPRYYSDDGEDALKMILRVDRARPGTP
jgi:ribosomal protein S18 acetylase RimI-like enzyme